MQVEVIKDWIDHDFFVYFSLAATAMIITFVVTPRARNLAYRVGALDWGRGRRVHVGVVPRLGGIAIFCAVVFPLLAVISRNPTEGFNKGLIGIVIAGGIVFATGVYDDIKGLQIKYKLGIETLAAVLLWLFHVRITAVTNPFNGQMELGLMSLPVTVLWVIVITNAFNLIDGLDGLASATGVLVAGALFVLAGDRDIYQSVVLLIVVGALVGFLRYNFPPASIFMGDSGSLFLGFALAAMSVHFSSKATAFATLLVPIIAFAHPLMDMGYAVLRRMYRGLPLGEPDREHIHHKLLDMGLSRQLVLAILTVMNGILMLVTWLIVKRQHGRDFLILLFLSILFVAGLKLLGYIEFSSFFSRYAKVIIMNRERRYLMYQIRRFLSTADSLSSIEELKPAALSILNEFGYDAAALNIYANTKGKTTVWMGGLVSQEEALRFSFPVVQDGVKKGWIDLYAKGFNHDIDASDLARLLAEEILKMMEKESVSSPVGS